MLLNCLIALMSGKALALKLLQFFAACNMSACACLGDMSDANWVPALQMRRPK